MTALRGCGLRGGWRTGRVEKGVLSLTGSPRAWLTALPQCPHCSSACYLRLFSETGPRVCSLPPKPSRGQGNVEESQKTLRSPLPCYQGSQVLP